MKQSGWFLLISGILSLTAGIYMFISPASSLASISFVFSAIMLFNGISETIQYLLSKEKRNGIALFNGIVTILLAICLLSSTWMGLASFIPYMFAFWVLLHGISKIFVGFAERKENKKEGNHLLLVGIPGTVIGIFMFSHPLFTGLIVAYMVGFGFVYQGISSFISFHRLSHTPDKE